MTDTQKATPRPWRLDKKAVIKRTVFDARQQIIVICQSDAGDCEANAALIVQAVNAFDAIREALEAVEWVIDHESTSFLRCPWCGAGYWRGTAPPPHESDCKRQAALAAQQKNRGTLR